MSTQSFTVDALPRPGQTVLASSLSSSPGGKGGNQAVAAARAGAPVQLVAALGTDPAADQLRTHLRDNGVGLDGVVTVPGPSGSAVIVVDSGAENTIVVAPGANAHLSVASADVRARGRRRRGGVVAAGDPDRDGRRRRAGGPGRGRGRDAQRVAGRRRTATSCGAAGLADVVVVNEAEAREWHWPVPHLVITRGAHGASYVGAGRTVRRARSRGRGRRHHRRGRCLRRGARRRMAGRARGCVAPRLRGRCVVHAGAGSRRLRAVRGSHRRRTQADPIDEPGSDTMTTTPRPAARRRLAGHPVSEASPGRDRSACAHWTGRRRATR